MPKSPQIEHRQLGTTTITARDDDFFNGYQAGSLAFRVGAPAVPLTDDSLYDFLCKQFFRVDTSDRFRTGYVSGWFAGLYGYQVPFRLTVPDALPQEVQR